MIFLFLSFYQKKCMGITCQIFIFRLIVTLYMRRFTLLYFMISNVIDDDHTHLKILCHYSILTGHFAFYYYRQCKYTTLIFSLSFSYSSIFLSYIYPLLYFIYSISSYTMISIFYSYTIRLL